MDEILSTPKAAELFGLNRFYAAELAKKSAEAGKEWPKKKGRVYVAPLSEWKKIFHPDGHPLRKPRNQPVVRDVSSEGGRFGLLFRSRQPIWNLPFLGDGVGPPEICIIISGSDFIHELDEKLHRLAVNPLW